MAGSILTPTSIWSDFKIEGEKNIETVEEVNKDGVIISRFYFDGRRVDGTPVRIFSVSARSEKLSLIPCVYVLPDFDKDIDEDFLISLAKKGYYAFSTDFSGEKENKKNYTVYPESVKYADFEKAKESLDVIEDDVTSSPWYEWDCVGKYALSYIFSQPFIIGVGTVGVKTGASILWHILAGEGRVSCAAFLFDAGWNAYFDKGNYKFDGKTPDFNDNDLKFLAGVDAQGYASLIKVPTLILSATNSEEYDFDRAADTLSRINKAVYSAIDYSVNASGVLTGEAYSDLTCFLDEVLLKGQNPEKVFPANPDVICDFLDGEFNIDADADIRGLKKIVLYVSEGYLPQSVRTWKAVDEIEPDELCDGQFLFKYKYNGGDACFFFVRAKYESGFTVSSDVICKKPDKKEITPQKRSNIIFSGREKLSETVFAPFFGKDYKSFINADDGISLEKGPMGILGLTGKNGLITYKINSAGDKPSTDSVFLMDIYAESDAKVIITLVSKDKTEYSFSVDIAASKVWRNFKAAVNRFKSGEGKFMKDYSQVNAIKITGEGKYLINNFLWV